MPIARDPLQQLRDLDRTSPRFTEQLSDFLHGNEYQDVVPKLSNEALAWLVEYLDNVLFNIPDHASTPFRESLHELRRICGVKEVLPKSCVISEPDLGCVFEGTLNGSKVRIRRVRGYPGGDPQKVRETFHQVAVISKHLVHPNIVPLLGITIDALELISDWIPGGHLTEYITNHPDVDIPHLLSSVAEGLSYLHSCDVIHGDLKGSNILVDRTGHARIADFGLAVVTRDPDFVRIRSASSESGQSTLWIAPEVLDSRGEYTKEADIFSLGGVAIEAFTGVAPFSDKSASAAILAITTGERPSRPTHPALTDSIWTLIQQCWNQGPRQRPCALRIACHLRGVPAWKCLIDNPGLISNERTSLVADIFLDRSEIEGVMHLSRGDAQSFVDAIAETLDSLGPRLRKKCLSTLCKICGHQALLPETLRVPLCYDRSGDPAYSGGFADVWMGTHQDRKVAVKVLRVFETSDYSKITSKFCKEVITWSSLHHPNVHPLMGVTMDGSHFAMVSEWMANGNVNAFIKTHWEANRFELLEDSARGLTYMHSQAMIHGDLKGANILIDQNGHARLTDFGLLTFVSDPTNPTGSSTATSAGTTRWMSPELLCPEQFGLTQTRPTKESDYYALGMVILEVLSGHAPFASDNEFIVMRKVTEGTHPERPKEVWFTDDLWRILEQCWSPRLRDRPNIETILACLGRLSITLPPSAGEPATHFETDSATMRHPCQTITHGGPKSTNLSQTHSSSVTNPEASHDSTTESFGRLSITLPPQPVCANEDMRVNTNAAGSQVTKHSPDNTKERSNDHPESSTVLQRVGNKAGAGDEPTPTWLRRAFRTIFG